jgi:hypothetical protein
MIHVAAVVYSDDREGARRRRRTFCCFKRRKVLPTLLAFGGAVGDSNTHVNTVELLAPPILYYNAQGQSCNRGKQKGCNECPATRIDHACPGVLASWGTGFMRAVVFAVLIASSALFDACARPTDIVGPAQREMPAQSLGSAEKDSTLSADEASDRLVDCVTSEAQHGKYDGGPTVYNILKGKCSQEWMTFLRACNTFFLSKGHSTVMDSCVANGMGTAQLAINKATGRIR